MVCAEVKVSFHAPGLDAEVGIEAMVVVKRQKETIIVVESCLRNIEHKERVKVGELRGLE